MALARLHPGLRFARPWKRRGVPGMNGGKARLSYKRLSRLAIEVSWRVARLVQSDPGHRAHLPRHPRGARGAPGARVPDALFLSFRAGPLAGACGLRGRASLRRLRRQPLWVEISGRIDLRRAKVRLADGRPSLPRRSLGRWHATGGAARPAPGESSHPQEAKSERARRSAGLSLVHLRVCYG